MFLKSTTNYFSRSASLRSSSSSSSPFFFLPSCSDCMQLASSTCSLAYLTFLRWSHHFSPPSSSSLPSFFPFYPVRLRGMNGGKKKREKEEEERGKLLFFFLPQPNKLGCCCCIQQLTTMLLYNNSCSVCLFVVQSVCLYACSSQI